KTATLTYVGSPAGRRALDLEVPPKIDIPSPTDSVMPRDSGIPRAFTIDVNPDSPLLSASWPRPPSTIRSSPPLTSSSTNSTNGHRHSSSFSPTNEQPFGGSHLN